MDLCMDIEEDQPERGYRDVTYVCCIHGLYLHPVKEKSYTTTKDIRLSIAA